MLPDKNKIKYFLYARKSSESEDKQIQSIDDQIKRLTELAERFDLKITKTYTEAKSAKQPNNRPIFMEMMERIKVGDANGILCWQINRLSRNPVDSGEISWLLQQGVIKSIQTIDRQFLPDDNVLLFSVESGMANQYILDLRKNTMRGRQSKLEKGWLPNYAPLGYINVKNDIGEKIIEKDPDRFDLVRKMWEMMLTGSYTPPKILEIINNQWGLTTKKHRRMGGKPLSRSGIYRIFTNPFYAGLLCYGGEEYQGSHPPMISLEEYDQVQIILGRKGKPRPKKHHFAYTGFIRCGECGCLITGVEKHKHIKSTGEIRSYIYYYCTRRKKSIECSQKKVITEGDLEKQVNKELNKYTILPEFREWALEHLNKHNDQEIEDRQKIYETQHKTLTKTQNELDELTKMRYRGLIDDETFIKEKNDLQKKIIKLKDELRGTEDRAEKWLELTEKTFNFATYARRSFVEGGLQIKKEILMALGWNPTLKDGELAIPAHKWLIPIAEGYPALEKKYKGLELAKNGTNKAKTPALASVRARWLRGWDLNPRPRGYGPRELPDCSTPRQ